MTKQAVNITKLNWEDHHRFCLSVGANIRKLDNHLILGIVYIMYHSRRRILKNGQLIGEMNGFQQNLVGYLEKKTGVRRLSEGLHYV